MNVQTFLQNTGERRFHYLSNEGNAGDGLIHAGFYQLAERLGLTLDSFEYPEDRRGKNLLVMGAGAFCRASWHKVDAIEYYSKRFENVYILPSTFEVDFEPIDRMLRNLPDNVTVFCRERYSHAAVLKVAPHPDKVHLDHDLAFHIDLTPWNKSGRGTLNAFRTDKESLLNSVPSPNFDLSSMGREFHHTLILDTISNFESVNTDRLHICIAGALLGKKVRVFEGNYHKIRSIYDYSLRDRFPNVTLCSVEELKELLTASKKSGLRRQIHHWLTKIPNAQLVLRELKRFRLKFAAK